MPTVKGAETITVRPYVGKDWEGDAEYGTPYDIPRCVVFPRYSREQETIIEAYVVMVPPRGDQPLIQARDRVVCRGEEWDVDGVPGMYRHKSTGREVANELHLKKVS